MDHTEHDHSRHHSEEHQIEEIDLEAAQKDEISSSSTHHSPGEGEGKRAFSHGVGHMDESLQHEAMDHTIHGKDEAPPLSGGLPQQSIPPAHPT